MAVPLSCYTLSDTDVDNAVVVLRDATGFLVLTSAMLLPGKLSLREISAFEIVYKGLPGQLFTMGLRVSR
eukprot:3604577-Rhodomonas_salina.3